MSEIIKIQDSRRVFVETLNELAQTDDKIIVLICDVGFLYLDDPNLKFKVINTGVTEPSTIIIAAAMALDGWKPFVYSMINFVAFRPFEIVRNAIKMHNAKVVLLGVKGSEKYKFLGFSNNMIFENEDTYHLKPYMKCFLPKTNDEVREAVMKAYKREKASYIRL